MRILDMTMWVLLVICLVLAGWFGNELYRYYSDYRIYNGLYMSERDKPSALENAHKYDKYGEWICVNVRGMSFKEAVSTCQHEAGHEIFSRIVEKHPEKIKDVMEVVGNET